MNSGSGEGESVVEDDWSKGMSESSLGWGLSGLCRIGTTGKTLGADGGGGRQGERGEGERVERLEQELGVAGGEWLASVQVAESKECCCRTVAAIRWMSSKVMWSMSLRSRRCRRCRHGAGDDVDGAGERGASSRMARGRWRPGLRQRRWTRIAAWRSDVEVHGGSETAM